MKQVILVRTDLKMPKGKACAQVAHASVECVLKSPKKLVNEWHAEGMKKVCLKVKDFEEMKHYMILAEEAGLVCSLITDAGHTVFKEPTVTCLGIGPDDESKIDKITGKLKML